ncbi:MAG: Na/Pi cotransporter family protein [Stomatobaculum sp.]|nr:Na/Pi cotransporter family protein [Stomatobaculum sp.]
MSIFDILTLFGGLAMFLYGMRLMGEGLKESSSGTLKVAMEHVTNNPVKAFLLGLVITAVIQSSTATIVITSGLVSVGILSLRQSLGIIIGANVGTTVTGQIIRLMDLNAESGAWLQLFRPSSLAPIALIIGIVILMGGKGTNSRPIGNIAIGFGVLFSGLMNMTGAVGALTESGVFENVFSGLGENPLLGYVTGATVAFILQSSSATIGILQAFSTSGLLTFKAIYAVIVGIYLGDCVTTAIVCSIGAPPEAKRVGVVNILFNLSETVTVLLVVTIIHHLGLLDSLWNRVVNSGIIANTNTIFNLGCAMVLFPMLPVYEKLAKKIIRDEPVEKNKYQEKLDALNPVFFDTPALALRSCYDILLTMFTVSKEGILEAVSLLEAFDENSMKNILQEEDNVDLMTDRVSKYIVELMPHLQSDFHISILDQYYKVVNEFERLGDNSARIATTAADLSRAGTRFSLEALNELDVLRSLTENILDKTELAFGKRDLESAYQIEGLADVMSELINKMKGNHLSRMCTGKCSVYSDVSYMNLLGEFKRISSVCSNVGNATVIRVRPGLAEQEHSYFENLRTGRNERYNAAYKEAHEKYFDMLKRKEEGIGN